MTSLAAVFSPIPGTPGRLSLVSPRSAAYSGYCAGVTPPHRSAMPGFVVERVVGDAALVVEDLDVRVGDELERVAVAGDDHDVDAVGRGARRERRDHVVGLDTRHLRAGVISSASSTSWISGSCDAKRSGVSLRPAL